KVLFSRALRAARPSGQTVTSCPMRGSSDCMNSCSDFSSSANRMRRLLCGGVAKRFLLDGLSRLQREPDRERTPLVQTRAGRLDLASMLINDAMADGQAQPRSLAGAAAGKERLKNVFQDLLRHAAACVCEHDYRHAVLLRDADGQRATL